MRNSQKMTDILAVLLNWNDTFATEKCIKSLLEQKEIPCDIIIIDNGSDENPESHFKQVFTGVKVIRNEQNMGVACGRNIGIQHAIEMDYEFVLLIDNDAYAHEQMLSALYRSAKKCKDGGIFGPKILIASKTDIIWRAGCTSWKWTYLHAGHAIIKRICEVLNVAPPLFLDTIRGEGRIDKGQFNQEEVIDFQIGCAQFIRTKIFREVGLLDEDFSPYGSEDIDFCARTNRSGWKIYYIPDAVCWHEKISSFRADYDRMFFNLKNLILLARKNLSFLYFFLFFIPDFILVHLPLLAFDNILKNRKSENRAVLDAVFWNLKDILRRGVLITKD